MNNVNVDEVVKRLDDWKYGEMFLHGTREERELFFTDLQALLESHAELVRDKERLDWLEAASGSDYPNELDDLVVIRNDYGDLEDQWHVRRHVKTGCSTTLRQAIDQAKENTDK